MTRDYSYLFEMYEWNIREREITWNMNVIIINDEAEAGKLSNA